MHVLNVDVVPTCVLLQERVKSYLQWNLIVKMRDHLTEKGAALRLAAMDASFTFRNTKGNQLAIAGLAAQESAAAIEEV